MVHWVEAEHALPASFRLYDRLFTVPDPASADDFVATLNPDSLVETTGWVEPSVADDSADTRYQFERLGYFWRDPQDSLPGSLVFNRIVPLRDSWSEKPAPAPAPTAPSEPAPVPAAPRDPASALDPGQRTRYDALVAEGVGEEEAAVLAADPALDALAEGVRQSGAERGEAAKLVVHEVRRALGDRPPSGSRAEPSALADVLAMVEAGTLTRNAATEAVAALVREGGTAQAVVEAKGLAAVRDADALAPAVDAALAENADEVARYRAGEDRLFGFFVGQAMRRAGKGADPKAVQALLRERLS